MKCVNCFEDWTIKDILIFFLLFFYKAVQIIVLYYVSPILGIFSLSDFTFFAAVFLKFRVYSLDIALPLLLVAGNVLILQISYNLSKFIPFTFLHILSCYALYRFLELMKKVSFRASFLDFILLLYPFCSAIPTIIIGLIQLEKKTSDELQYEVDYRSAQITVVSFVKLPQLFFSCYFATKNAVAYALSRTNYLEFCGIFFYGLALFSMPLFSSLAFHGIVSPSVQLISFIVGTFYICISVIYSLRKAKRISIEFESSSNNINSEESGNIERYVSPDTVELGIKNKDSSFSVKEENNKNIRILNPELRSSSVSNQFYTESKKETKNEEGETKIGERVVSILEGIGMRKRKHTILIFLFCYKVLATSLVLVNELFVSLVVTDYPFFFAVIGYFRVQKYEKRAIIILTFFCILAQILAGHPLLTVLVYSVMIILFSSFLSFIVRELVRLSYNLTIFDVAVLLYPLFFIMPILITSLFSLREDTEEELKYEMLLKSQWSTVISVVKILQVYANARFVKMGGIKQSLSNLKFIEYLRFFLVIILLLYIPFAVSLEHYGIVKGGQLFVDISFVGSYFIVVPLLFQFILKNSSRSRSEAVIENKPVPNDN